MGSEDLVDLPSRCSLDQTVEELSRRFDQGSNYTWLSGAPRYDVLVAINPFHVQHAADSAELATLMQATFNLLLNPARLETVAIRVRPHVFAVMASALDALLHEKRKQSLIFIGESGSGKTFATSQCLGFLKYATERYNNRTQGHLTGNAAIRARRRRNKMPSSSSLNEHAMAVQSIESKLLEANTVLEAFGNARTLTNDNSSRFGKWMELIFDMSKPMELLKVKTARMKCFLLEANRVIAQRKGECGFHIFYFLLASVHKETLTLGLEGMKKCKYLTFSKKAEAEAEDESDDEGFDRLCRAMQALGFSEEDIHWVFRIAAAVLHLGNISFIQDGHNGQVNEDDDDDDDDDDADADSDADADADDDDDDVDDDDDDDDALGHAARLLGLLASDVKNVFVNKTLVVKGEHIIVPVNGAKASVLRDAFAKFVYRGLFRWVVAAVNDKLGDDEDAQGNRLGLLDIFGFERLVGETNSLEQLCINYTNEVILHSFNENIHDDEDEFYALEEIEFKSSSLHSNIHVIKAVHSVFHAIQEHSMLTDKGSNTTRTLTLNPDIEGVEVLALGKAFVIQHSSGAVGYACDDLAGKNREEINAELYKVLERSEETRTRELIEEEPEDGYLSFQQRKSISQSTLTSFRSDLAHLTTLLQKSTNRYVHCIKSNMDRIPNTFDMEFCRQQVLHSNVLSTLHKRQQGFPYRLLHDHFLRRYSNLVQGTQLSSWINQQLRGDQSLAQVGRLRVFMKSEAFLRFEALLRDRSPSAANAIQRAWRRYKLRQTVHRLETYFQERKMESSTLKDIISQAPRRYTCAKLKASNRVLAELESWETLQGDASNVDAVAHFAKLEKLIGYLPPPAVEEMKLHLQRNAPTPTPTPIPAPAPAPQPTPVQKTRKGIIKQRLRKSLILMEWSTMQHAVAEAEAEGIESSAALVDCKRALQMDMLDFTKYGIERAKQNYDTILHVRRTFDLLRYLLQPGESIEATCLKHWLLDKNTMRQREIVSSLVEQQTVSPRKKSVLEACRRSRELIELQEQEMPQTPVLQWSAAFQPVFVGLQGDVEETMFLLVHDIMERGNKTASLLLINRIARQPELYEIALALILKQLEQNPTAHSVQNGLQLLRECLGCFPTVDERLFQCTVVWLALHLPFEAYKGLVFLAVLSEYRSLLGRDHATTEDVKDFAEVPSEVMSLSIPPIPQPVGFVNILITPVD